MADQTGLAELNPYDLQDTECAKLAVHFGALEQADWAIPSACAGWSRHDVLAHLVAIEQYFTACLETDVKALMQRYIDQGASSLDEFNAAGVEAGADTAPDELLAKWCEHNESNRAGFRAADGTDIDSSIGTYPGRAQAFHAAFEYAVHGNDVGVGVGGDEADSRQEWMAGIALFALTEVKADAKVDVADGMYTVTLDGETATFDRDTFVAGVAGRALPGDLGETEIALLSLGY